MDVNFLLKRFRAHAAKDALIWRDLAYSYGWLARQIDVVRSALSEERIAPGTVVSLEADYSPVAVATLLGLMECNAIIVPLTSSVGDRRFDLRRIAQVERIIAIDREDELNFSNTGVTVEHPILCELKNTNRSGLVLFSSGSSGTSKAAVHDFQQLLEKFRVQRHRKRILAFLLFDHIGGLNTLLYSLSNCGCIVTVEDRNPDAICLAIDRHRVQILPTSPTFLNLLLVSGASSRHSLSSLELITYGTEVMPQSTLSRLNQVLPHVKTLQTYGLSEIGILRSKSKSSDSLWVKVGGEGFRTRVVDGMLEIKSRSAMLGYLNAPSPFTDDGWFRTGDAVEVDGDYLKILGRQSEIINVGGEKVYPAEVESVLQNIEGVDDVLVRGEPNPLTGQIVTAVLYVSSDEDLSTFRKRMRAFCDGKLPRFAIPQKVSISKTPIHGDRFKKMRNFGTRASSENDHKGQGSSA